MIECRFESGLGLELSSFSMWHCLKLVVGGFLRVLRFAPLLHGFSRRNRTKTKTVFSLQLSQTYKLSCPFACLISSVIQGADVPSVANKNNSKQLKTKTKRNTHTKQKQTKPNKQKTNMHVYRFDIT